MKIRLWLQRPPREEWVLRIVHETREGKVVVRTWFHEYGPGRHPPPSVVLPAALTCARIARAALEGRVEDHNFTLEVKA